MSGNPEIIVQNIAASADLASVLDLNAVAIAIGRLVRDSMLADRL